VMTSDNGYHHGQNRRGSKFIPYTPSLQVPIWLRGPRVAPRGINSSRMVSGVDVAATIYDATGAKPSRVLDGQSLLAPSTRREVYAKYFNDSANLATIPSWATVRGRTFQYIETYDISTGALAFREWYDLAADPYMLRNLLADGDPGNDPATGAVATRLAGYRTCAGTKCPR
ncbi:MAG TPA: sulfatase/phosphatase domain-containing protein, partial [Blastococcus sp.]